MKFGPEPDIHDELRELRKLVEEIASGGSVHKRMYTLPKPLHIWELGKPKPTTNSASTSGR